MNKALHYRPSKSPQKFESRQKVGDILNEIHHDILE